MSNTKCKRIFRYGLSPEIFGYALVQFHIQNLLDKDFITVTVKGECNNTFRYLLHTTRGTGSTWFKRRPRAYLIDCWRFLLAVLAAFFTTAHVKCLTQTLTRSNIHETLLISQYSKIKLPLCITKYHAMKMYPALNKAPNHEDVCRIGGIGPRIFQHGTR
jgi:hypothetical protein